MSNDRDYRSGYDNLMSPGNGDWDSFRRGQEQRRHDDYFRAQQQAQYTASTQPVSGASSAGSALGEGMAALIFAIYEWYARQSPGQKANLRRLMWIVLAMVVLAGLGWLALLKVNDVLKERQQVARLAETEALEARDARLRLPEAAFLKVATESVDLASARRTGSPTHREFQDVTFTGERLIQNRQVRFELEVDVLPYGGLPVGRHRFTRDQVNCRYGSIQARAIDDPESKNYQAYSGPICSERIREAMNRFL